MIGGSLEEATCRLPSFSSSSFLYLNVGMSKLNDSYNIGKSTQRATTLIKTTKSNSEVKKVKIAREVLCP